MSELIVPGKFKCDHCGFVMVRVALVVPEGKFIKDLNPKGEPCPNDSRPMRPLTWKEEAEQSDAAWKKLYVRHRELGEALIGRWHYDNGTVEDAHQAMLAKVKELGAGSGAVAADAAMLTEALHQCTACGTYWRLWKEGKGWSLADARQKPCRRCDNSPEFLELLTPLPAPAVTWQARVSMWLVACFGVEVAQNRLLRSLRFFEEACELAQAVGTSKDVAQRVLNYVYDRPKGAVRQEVGGVMTTLTSLCYAHGIGLDEAAEAELKAVWQRMEQIRAKQSLKDEALGDGRS